jgi:hypothetical protein
MFVKPEERVMAFRDFVRVFTAPQASDPPGVPYLSHQVRSDHAR